MEDTLVTIASYSTITDATIFRDLLRLEGIESAAIDSNAPLTPSVPSIHYGGVRLVVREEDVAKAFAVLKKSESR